MESFINPISDPVAHLEKRSVLVGSVDKGRLFVFLRKTMRDLVPSRAQARNAVRRGEVVINGTEVRCDVEVSEGDKVEVERDMTQMQQDMVNPDIEILLDDPHIAIVWKTAGVRMSGEQSLESSLKVLLTESPMESRLSSPRCLSSLPRSMAGLVLVSKTTEALQRLTHLINDGRIDVSYRALVLGKMGNIGSEVFIENHIDNWPAITTCKVVKLSRTRSTPSSYLSTIEASPLVSHSRIQHQVRRHLQMHGFPIIGNVRYSRSFKSEVGIYCCLSRMSLVHPFTAKEIEFEREEPLKFDNLRRREEKFWRKKLDDDSLSLKMTGVSLSEDTSCVMEDEPLAYKTGEKVLSLFSSLLLLSPNP